ncbi:MAG: cell envelope integrity protein CreD [Cryomorphaceae bacterium]|nr:cell envelope integrity protein CreD [Cryomorphaceae bacterium]
MTEKSSFEKFREWVANSSTLKLLGIGFILLILLIPIEMVRDIIQERQYYQFDVQQEITSSWGHEQVIEGPVLTVPYDVTTFVRTTENKTEEIKTRYFAHFLPETLDYSGALNIDTLHRGIYSVNVYTADMKISGSFVEQSVEDWQNDHVDILWDKCQISVGIPDQRGVQEELFLNWNDEKVAFSSGIKYQGLIKEGVSALIDLSDSTSRSCAFNMDLELRGSNRFGLSPLGKVSTAAISSSWKDPKYFGEFPPDYRNDPNESGFEANWKILHLNRSIPQSFTDVNFNSSQYVYGVEIFEEVGEYRKTERSAKYAVLFIALTFVTFFFIQVIRKVQLHALQFIIVGLALCLFYVLLLSLSEYIGFNSAYVIAATAVVVQITWYVKHIFNNTKLSIIVMAILGLLYFFIFTLVQLANYSLLMGSIGLFIVMGVLMYMSRNLDWSKKKSEPPVVS